MASAVLTGSLQLGGQDRPFAVGSAQEAALRALHHRKDSEGQPMSAAAYRQAFGPATLREGPLNGQDVRDFVYAALVAGYASHGLRPNFTFVQVGQWLAADPAAAQPLWNAVAPRPAKRVTK